jgi:hypothetical protein
VAPPGGAAGGGAYRAVGPLGTWEAASRGGRLAWCYAIEATMAFRVALGRMAASTFFGSGR